MSRGTDLQSRVATFHLTVPTLALARQAACTNVAELAAARTHTVKTVPDPLLPFFRRPSAFPRYARHGIGHLPLLYLHRGA